MKKRGEYVCFVLIVVALLLLNGYFTNRVKSFQSSMSVRYQDIGMSAEQINQLCLSVGTGKEEEETEIPYVTGWDKISGTKIRNTSLGTESTVDLLEVWGDMSQVIPCELVAGAFVSKMDSRGCVISEKTAQNLFRSSEVMGVSLIYNDTEYIVRGIVKMSTPIMLIQQEGKEAFPFLELNYQRDDFPASNTKAFLSQQEIGEYLSFIEYNFYGGIAGIFSGIPIVAILTFIIRYLWECVKTMDHALSKYIVKGICIVFGFVLL